MIFFSLSKPSVRPHHRANRELAFSGQRLDGVVDLSSGTSLVKHRTPLSERWGGWYVTGSSGGQAHRGNLFGKAAFGKHEQDQNATADVKDLKQFFDASRYPGPRSDIVALMVLEHQTHMHNFITRLQYEATMALQTSQGLFIC